MLLLPPVQQTITIHAEWTSTVWTPIQSPFEANNNTSRPLFTEHYATNSPPDTPLAVGRAVKIIGTLKPTSHTPEQSPSDPPNGTLRFQGKIAWTKRIDRSTGVVGVANDAPDEEVIMAYVTMKTPFQDTSNRDGNVPVKPRRKRGRSRPPPYLTIPADRALDQTNGLTGTETWGSRGPILRVMKWAAQPNVGGEVRRWRVRPSEGGHLDQ